MCVVSVVAVAVLMLAVDAASAQDYRMRGRRARVWDYDNEVQTVSYETPAGAVTQEMPVYIELRTPANAEVMFDGAKTTQMGTHRVYVSPPLKPGHSYTYEIKTKWNVDGQDVTQSRTVTVQPGATVMVDFMGPQPRTRMMPADSTQPQEWRTRGRRGRVWVQDNFAYSTPAGSSTMPSGPAGDQRRANYPAAEPIGGATREMPVYVDVLTPAGAEILFDGEKTTQMGSRRLYVSPPIKPGQNYAYQIKAKWNDNGREVIRDRKVTVHAGETVMVDLNKTTPADQGQK
jgi:uncharacterized protein (TIGR03000 family)